MLWHKYCSNVRTGINGQTRGLKQQLAPLGVIKCVINHIIYNKVGALPICKKHKTKWPRGVKKTAEYITRFLFRCYLNHTSTCCVYDVSSAIHGSQTNMICLRIFIEKLFTGHLPSNQHVTAKSMHHQFWDTGRHIINTDSSSADSFSHHHSRIYIYAPLCDWYCIPEVMGRHL